MIQLAVLKKEGWLDSVVTVDEKKPIGYSNFTLNLPPEGMNRFVNGSWVSEEFVEPVVVPQEPVPPVVVFRTKLSRREFKSLFTPAEYRAISTATTTDDILFQFWDIAQTADIVDLEFPQTAQAMGYLVVTGLLTQERHDLIMQGVGL